MISKITESTIDNDSRIQQFPRSPKNKITRKPDNNRNKLGEDKDKKIKSNAHQFIGFYSPKHVSGGQGIGKESMIGSVKSPQAKIIKNQRSLTHFNKANCSNNRVELTENKRKDNSVSNSSGKSQNNRKISRLQLQLKALTYENNRLKTENQTLTEQNISLKNSLLKFNKIKDQQSKFNNSEKINRLTHTNIKLQQQITQLKQQLLQLQLIKQSKTNLQTFIKTLQTINQQQRQQLFKQDQLNKYQQIQLRTLKKHKVTTLINTKLQNDYLSIQSDNKRLRKLVFQLQNKLKTITIFDLTPDASQTDSLLLD